MPREGDVRQPRFSLLPADVLDVFVGANCQAVAPFETPALEHLATIGSGHALAEAVNTHTAADMRLVRAFCCHSKFLIKTDFEHQTAVLCRGFLKRGAIITEGMGLVKRIREGKQRL